MSEEESAPRLGRGKRMLVSIEPEGRNESAPILVMVEEDMAEGDELGCFRARRESEEGGCQVGITGAQGRCGSWS